MPSRQAKPHRQPEDILAGHTPWVHERAQQLRDLIRTTLPDATERGYPGWHAIGYRHRVSVYFCGIFPQQESVRLGFEWGARLPDPEGVLGGTGKQVRYLEVRPGEEIDEQVANGPLVNAISLKG
jgi:hypothetical protein